MYISASHLEFCSATGKSVIFSYKPQTKKGERNLPKKDQTIGEIIEAKNGIYFVGSDIELVDVGPVLFVDKNDVPAEDYSKLREMLKGVFLEKYYDYSAEILSTLPAFLLSSFIDCDYGIWGVALISLLYLAKSIKISAVIMAVLLVPYYGQHIYSNVVSFEAIRNMCFSLLSILFVCLYNGQHGSKKKWIYYWAYPLHILFFAILRCYPFF